MCIGMAGPIGRTVGLLVVWLRTGGGRARTRAGGRLGRSCHGVRSMGGSGSEDAGLCRDGGEALSAQPQGRALGLKGLKPRQ